jgi:LemA protein
MKTWQKVLLIVLGVILVSGIALFSKIIGINNKIVALEEQAKTQWGQVQNVYQRRLDLIPNLVETVKGYAAHEKETLEGVAEARARMGGVVNIPKEAINNPEMMRKYADAQGMLGAALQRLMAVAEKYPDLKANENFLALQSQLEGTENRISVERRRFNETVQEYNTFIRIFPNSLVAGFKGVQRMQVFEAETAAQQAPKVKF